MYVKSYIAYCSKRTKERRANKDETFYAEYNREIVIFLGVDKRSSSNVLDYERRRDEQQGYEDLMEYFRKKTLVEVREVTLPSRSTEEMWLERMKSEADKW